MELYFQYYIFLDASERQYGFIQQFFCNLCSLCSSTVNPLDSGNKQLWGMSNDDDDMCVIDDKEEFSHNDVKYKSLMSTDIEVIVGPYCFI